MNIIRTEERIKVVEESVFAEGTCIFEFTVVSSLFGDGKNTFW